MRTQHKRNYPKEYWIIDVSTVAAALEEPMNRMQELHI
jgi:hypothetical protein